MAKRKAILLDLPVAFGNLSIGDTSCRLGLTISRANLDVTEADATLCCKRLSAKIVANANGNREDQPALPTMEDAKNWEVQAIADVKGFSAGGKTISVGLTFALSTVKIETLAHFPRREGKLVVDGVEDLPEEKKHGEHNGDNGNGEAE